MSSETNVWLGASTRQLIQSRTGYRRRKFTNAIMLAITALFTLAALAVLFWIIIYVVIKGLQYLNLDFFIHLPRPLGITGGGVLNAIEGTIILTILASLFAVIPGILAAYYVAYNPNTPLGIVVRFGTDVLSGVPSIIIGLFCYALIVKYSGSLLRPGGQCCPGHHDVAHHYSHHRGDDQAGAALLARGFSGIGFSGMENSHQRFPASCQPGDHYGYPVGDCPCFR